MLDYLRAWRGLLFPVYLILGAMGLGTLGYSFVFPDESFLRLLYMTGITLTTVGYGDVLGVEHNSWAIIYTLFLMILGMGVILYSTSILTAYIVEGNLRNAFARERVRRKVKKMKGHYIICGAGETGIHVIREMVHMKEPCVVIEKDEELRKTLGKEFPEVPIVIGDATLDGVLEKAGIEQAEGLVAALSNDKDNLFLTVSAKLLKPNLTIVAKAIELTMIKKLNKAGASRVVSPNYIGGTRMASEILKPHVTTLLDQMLRGRDESIKVDEVRVPAESSLVGKTLGEANFFSTCGVNILAIGKKAGHYHYHPGPEDRIEEEDILLYVGNPTQEKHMKSLVKN